MAIPIQRKNGSRKVAGVSMAPMIDMVFLLLVFFMTASAVSQSGSKLELDLPESTNAKVAQNFSQRLILSVNSEGAIYLGTSEVTPEELSERLVTFRKDAKDGKLNIRAAKDTPFSSVKRVMAIAAAAGIDDYVYSSYESGAI